MSGAVEPPVREDDPYANETMQQRDARMAWWREAKFGMFIHWGVYAVPAGVHNNVRDGEWIMRRAEIPVKEYRDYAKRFTAENYDPQAWVDLASRAGMRYIVLTAKHHDGFALYPSSASDWNAVDASPAGRDLIAPLAGAARAKGLKFGLYYSHSQDWVHPGGAKWRYEEGAGWDDAHKGAYDDYLKSIAIPQVREILTRYQPDLLWWDTPHYMTPERASPLAELLRLRPGIIHNDRLGGGYHGDTETPENFIPPAGLPGKDWETCMTMNDNWGYVLDDHDWKSSNTIIRQLVDIVSKGGNYLLNVGPDATGRIPQESVDRLNAVGRWMKVNGEAVYGTHAGPFSCRLPWGRVTTKSEGADTVLYLHILDFPEDGRLVLPGLKSEVLSTGLLGSTLRPSLAASPYGLSVILPCKAEERDPETGTTIQLLVKGKPEVVKTPVLADPDGVTRLTPMDARLSGALELGQSFGRDRVDHWQNPSDQMSWTFVAAKSGTCSVRLKAATEADGQVVMMDGPGDFKIAVPKVELAKRDVRTVEVGSVELKQGKTYCLRLQAHAEDWKSVNVFGVELR